MKCHACDKDMSDKEINYNEELGDYEMCTTCLDIALDAAYSQGFQTEDDIFVIDSGFDGDGSDIIYAKGSYYD